MGLLALGDLIYLNRKLTTRTRVRSNVNDGVVDSRGTSVTLNTYLFELCDTSGKTVSPAVRHSTSISDVSGKL
ncbi:hypothetical protein PsYK624_091440 [Phanerochaete sordida]|uniref:Uncharacterized protein n=1 Tax=Phanerochaete sordida TaxID=48140 RepID=A0A9P3GFW3_9APHY|nr:hypothetical protein PsYK624_091440 [Phanerochaete sordida]